MKFTRPRFGPSTFFFFSGCDVSSWGLLKRFSFSVTTATFYLTYYHLGDTSIESSAVFWDIFLSFVLWWARVFALRNFLCNCFFAFCCFARLVYIGPSTPGLHRRGLALPTLGRPTWSCTAFCLVRGFVLHHSLFLRTSFSSLLFPTLTGSWFTHI